MNNCKNMLSMLLLIAVVFVGAPAEAVERVKWTEIRIDNVRKINSDVVRGMPTVDVGIYYPANLDVRFSDGFPLDALLEQFVEAKKIYSVAGVQLNLLWVKTGAISPFNLDIQANDASSLMPDSNFENLYVNSYRHQSGLSRRALDAFDSIVEENDSNDRTLYIVVLQKVFMSFYDKIDERTWALRTIHTGGLSFPSYSYSGIPKRLRGVITVSRDDPLEKIVAHEIGHKVINVSHEYMDINPEHEVRAEGGLMVYGAGKEIPSGMKGRWHRERLHLSPYVYRLAANGTRLWNPDYNEGGHYYDPIYGDKAIKFEPVSEKGGE